MRVHSFILCLALLAAPVGQAHVSSAWWLLPLVHSDELHVQVKVNGREGVTPSFSADRMVISTIGGAAITFFSMKVADVISAKNINVLAGQFMPFDYFLASLVAGHVIRFSMGLWMGPIFIEHASRKIEPNEVRHNLVFNRPWETRYIRELLARKPYLLSKETGETFTAQGLVMETTLGEKRATELVIDGKPVEGEIYYIQDLVVDRVMVKGKNVRFHDTETTDLEQLVMGKSCRSWFVRLARLLF